MISAGSATPATTHEARYECAASLLPIGRKNDYMYCERLSQSEIEYVKHRLSENGRGISICAVEVTACKGDDAVERGLRVRG